MEDINFRPDNNRKHLIDNGIKLISLSRRIDSIECEIDDKKEELAELIDYIGIMLTDVNRQYYQIMKSIGPTKKKSI